MKTKGITASEINEVTMEYGIPYYTCEEETYDLATDKISLIDESIEISVGGNTPGGVNFCDATRNDEAAYHISMLMNRLIRTKGYGAGDLNKILDAYSKLKETTEEIGAWRH